jgi:hypothetical protein
VINLTDFTERIATLSTDHIPKHTADALGKYREDCVVAELWGYIHYEPWGDFGWIIWASSEYCEDALAPHPELAALLAMCAERRIQWLRLDCDAPPHPELPTFEWEPT